MKTKKAFSKRLKLTKRGKLLGRKAGQGHFNAKESGEHGTAKRRKVEWPFKKRIRDAYLGGNGNK